MKKLINFVKNLFKRPEGKKSEREELLVSAAQGSTWAVKHYGKAIEKLAEHDRNN